MSQILRSSVLDRALTQAVGIYKRSDIKNCSVGTTDTRGIDDFVKGMIMMQQIMGIQKPMIYGVAKATAFFFNTSNEQEVLDKLSGLREVKRTPTPNKVLLKMGLARMHEVMKAIVAVNRSKQNSRDYLAQQRLEKPGEFHPQDPVDLEFPDLSNVQNILAFQQRISNPAQSRNGDIAYLVDYHWIGNKLDDLILFTKKPEVNEIVIQESWDLCSVAGVMES